ncbi:uncharacterized protein LOC122047977 [Zingiber officinale]|uniref:uncharacterized protein LOC122047977 n=1 Tax=Zingiber officinale TaxID=94328 RepID=UPI001C4DBE94|nr:uncharacterized protein LOC122047977 [Zingiber officinale]
MFHGGRLIVGSPRGMPLKGHLASSSTQILFVFPCAPLRFSSRRQPSSSAPTTGGNTYNPVEKNQVEDPCPWRRITCLLLPTRTSQALAPRRFPLRPAPVCPLRPSKCLLLFARSSPVRLLSPRNMVILMLKALTQQMHAMVEQLPYLIVLTG